MRRLTDTERIRLMEAPGAAVGEAWLDLYGSLLRDGSLPHGLKAYLLRIEELSVDRRFLPWYRERCAARVALMRTVAERFGPDLKRAFDALDTYARGETPKDGIEARRLKAVLLRIVAESDTPAAHGLCDEHFRRAWNLTDRLSALECINASNHPERDARLDVGHGLWRGHPAAYASYLSLVGARRDETVFDRIAREEARPGFELPHPSHSRSLYLGFTANNRMLWTTRGIAWVRDTVIKMASVNENTANRVLACFQMVRCLAGDLQAEVRAALNRMQAGIDASRAPSVAGRVQTYLEG
jgi:aminopeptidase N